MSAIQTIVGTKVVSVRYDQSAFVGLQVNQSDGSDNLVLDEFMIITGAFILQIYNPYQLITATGDVPPDSLIGEEVVQVEESESETRILFTTDISLIVDLRHESYRGPEAMALIGPDDLFMVWN